VPDVSPVRIALSEVGEFPVAVDGLADFEVAPEQFASELDVL
jgi:hypothetical protein